MNKITATIVLGITPPAYPLGAEAFQKALITGHGRALVHARRHGGVGYRDEILHAATHCLVYDSQFDGHREWWLARLCETAGLVETIIRLEPDGSTKDRCLRAGLLKEFCLAGHPEALGRLYAMCCRVEDSNDFVAVGELIEIEGEKGLIFAARKLGEELQSDADFWVGGWELSEFDLRHGDGAALPILVEAAKNDSSIARFLTEYEAVVSQAAPEEMKRKRETAGDVIQAILASTTTQRIGRLRSWGNRATADERKEIAALLKAGSPTMVLVNALWCLSGKGCTEFDESWLQWVFHEDEKVRLYASRLLSHHQDPRIRSAGLVLIKRGELSIGLEVLRRSAASEDAAVIVEALSHAELGEDSHAVVSYLVQMLEKNEAVREPALPMFVYEFSPCMLCREMAMEFLIKWGMCPSWVLEEAVYDASEDIRKLAETGFAG